MQDSTRLLGQQCMVPIIQFWLRISLERADKETYDVVGPICESGDALAKDRTLPVLRKAICWPF